MKRRRALLCDEMGLGKSLQALAAVEEYVIRKELQPGPRLIVAPASVLGSWKREIGRYLPPDTPHHVIPGKLPAQKREALITDAINENAWIIVNWEQIALETRRVPTRNGGMRTVKGLKQPLLEKVDWQAIIADEVHYAKSRTAKRSRGLWRLQSKHIQLGLTGTALMNNPAELWSPLSWLWPSEFHERGFAHNPGAMAYWPFYSMYVDYYEDDRGRKTVVGVRNPDGLRSLLRGRLIRRITSQVHSLPGRRRIYFPIELSTYQRKLYDQAEKEMWLRVEKDAEEGNKDAQEILRNPEAIFRLPNGAARTIRLLQLIENPALLEGNDDSPLMDDFVERFENSRPNQWVVFCKHKGSCELLGARLRAKGYSVGIYNGDVDPADRTELEDQFQLGNIDVMIGTIAAMFQGITLTAAHHQYWLTRDYVPDINEQGEARCDRIGQQNQVIVYIPQAVNTVASGRLQQINRLKESIVRTVVAKDDIQEETNAKV